VRLCAFDLDHTLVRTPLDLAAMAADMRAHLERAGACLPAREERYRVGELLRFCKREMPALEPALWMLALEREQRAMDQAALEPGALDAVAGARRLGFVTALWTNNAGGVTRGALERLGLDELFDVVVTRDEMRELKPHPDGWRVIAGLVDERTCRRISRRATAAPGRSERWAGGARGGRSPLRLKSRGHVGAPMSSDGAATASHRTFMVGDSWVDGLAAAAAGVPFIAYRMNLADLARWNLKPVVTLTDLTELPAWLADR